ncbi:predicted protein [Postia placenta Mad-698-R]|uniref:Retrotransposon gag domain-containing protein n=1 Tax=Postia placenta MAD-698-R-SB12 TaxID=670580 RepID=A0A1X6N9H4_9APHY|nr:hypothetical protein POSPLADRAFT_1134740 [Postia placenta MAD-698-R-SB12]EED79531.1 predicted protein [Postia placenta Mad-698-R]OSX65295.1 hypothetical protein POSPLADRAFT_1134740 [Postia placenta MAD-698-R-SB12]
MLCTDQLHTDQRAQPPLNIPCYAHLPVLPPSIVAACQGQIHAFDSQDLIDVYIPDDPETVLYCCEQQPCPNRTPRSIEEDYPRYKAIRRAQHPLGPRSTLASRSASRHSCPVSPTSRLPQTVADQARGDLPPDPAPEPEPEEGDSEEGVSESESADPARPASPTALASASAIPDVRNPSAELPPVPSPPTPPRGRSSTRSSRSSTGGRPPQPPPPPQRPPSPPMPIMSSPAAALDKETLKLLLPLRYDGKTVIECNRFLSQLRIYWLINTSLTTIELKVQVALSLLDGDARAWATPYFAQLVSVQIGVQGAMTSFANEAAFAAAFKAHFGNLDDEAAAQVELAKLCADKSVREKRTAAEFSALFKGPADRSGYGDLELRDKYLSGIPSRVYRKIELETFTTWQAAEKHVTEVEQILDISRARRPELNNFFSARG